MDDHPPLRRNVRYQLLWVGSAVSLLGVRVSTLAYPLVVLAVTGSAALAGTVGAATLASGVLLGLPAGALVDRWDRRRILIGCDLVRALGMASIAVALAGGWLTIGHVLAVAVLQGAAGALFQPARTTAIRSVVPAAQLRAALAQEEARAHGTSLLGPPLGGALFALGRAVPFLLDALSYLVSLICVLLVRVPRRPADRTDLAGDGGDTGDGLLRDITEGVRWLLRERLVRALVLVAPLFNVATTGVTLLIVILLRGRGAHSGTIGLVLAAEGVAGLVGAALASRIVRLLPPGRLTLLLLWSSGFLVIGMPAPLGAWWVALLLGLGTMVVPALNIVVVNEIMTAAPDRMQGRAMSALVTATAALTPLGPLAAGVVADLAGPATAMLVLGGYLLCCAAVATTSPTLRGTAAASGRDADLIADTESPA